jgi:hypothetical protein
LGRFLKVVFRPAGAEFDEDVDQHGHNDEKNAEADEKHEVRRLEE